MVDQVSWQEIPFPHNHNSDFPMEDAYTGSCFVLRCDSCNWPLELEPNVTFHWEANRKEEAIHHAKWEANWEIDGDKTYCSTEHWLAATA